MPRRTESSESLGEVVFGGRGHDDLRCCWKSGSQLGVRWRGSEGSQVMASMKEAAAKERDDRITSMSRAG